MRGYGLGTAAIGVIHVVYNVLWIGRSEGPLPIPSWLVWFELAWAVVSFVIVAKRRDDGPALLLAGTYILYTAFAVTYSWWLGTTYGEVTDAMIPGWWKALAVFVGAWFTASGLRLASRRPEPVY